MINTIKYPWFFFMVEAIYILTISVGSNLNSMTFFEESVEIRSRLRDAKCTYFKTNLFMMDTVSKQTNQANLIF